MRPASNGASSLSQFPGGGLQGGGEVALGFFLRLQDGGLQQVVLDLPLGKAGGDLGDLRVVLDQPRDDDADVVEGQFGDEPGEDLDEFGVGFLAVLDRCVPAANAAPCFPAPPRQLGVQLTTLKVSSCHEFWISSTEGTGPGCFRSVP